MKKTYTQRDNKKGWRSAAALAAALLITFTAPLAAFAGDTAPTNQLAPTLSFALPEGQQQEEEDDALLLAEKMTITFEQANEIALKANEGATVIKASVEDEGENDELVVYEVALWTADKQYVQMKINAADGAIMPEDEKADDDKEEKDGEDDASIAALAVLTQQQAIDAAIAATPGATVFATDLDDENGVPVYEITILTAEGTYVEVKVDAVTGTILPEDAENEEDGDDDEKKDEKKED